MPVWFVSDMFTMYDFCEHCRYKDAYRLLHVWIRLLLLVVPSIIDYYEYDIYWKAAILDKQHSHIVVVLLQRKEIG